MSAASGTCRGRAVETQPPGRPRRPLTTVDRLVRVPLGFVYFLFLGLLGVPVAIVMTFLYYASRSMDRLSRLPPRPGGPRGRGEEPAA